MATNSPLQIAIWGTGRAGRTRSRDVEASEACALVAAESMRDKVSPDTIGDPSVDAVIICTENARHYPLAKAALLAGKHVAVEYPLCQTAAQARELYELAHESSLTLHVEVISLLSQGYRDFSAALGSAPGPVELSSHFAGGSYRWVAEEIRAGRLSQLALGRLYVVASLVPDLEVVDAACQRGQDAYSWTARLVAGNTTVRLSEQRAPDMSRGWELKAIVGDRELKMQRTSRLQPRRKILQM